MRRMAFAAAALLLSAVSLRPQAQQPAQFSPLDLVGTWTLDSAEPGTLRREAEAMALLPPAVAMVRQPAGEAGAMALQPRVEEAADAVRISKAC